MRFLSVTITLILLAGCTQVEPPVASAPLQATVLDLDEGPEAAPTITDQVKTAEANNEGGLSARNRAAREASSQLAGDAPPVPATVGAP